MEMDRAEMMRHDFGELFAKKRKNIMCKINQYIHLCTVHPLEVHQEMNVEGFEKTRWRREEKEKAY